MHTIVQFCYKNCHFSMKPALDFPVSHGTSKWFSTHFELPLLLHETISHLKKSFKLWMIDTDACHFDTRRTADLS